MDNAVGLIVAMLAVVQYMFESVIESLCVECPLGVRLVSILRLYYSTFPAEERVCSPEAYGDPQVGSRVVDDSFVEDTRQFR